MFSIDIPPGTPPPRRAVVAEADPALRAALAVALRQCGFTVAAAADPMAALALVSEAETALALFSRGGRHDGEQAAALAVALSPHTRILLTTPGADGADAAPADGDPFPILPLTADPVRLAARLRRWLASTPLAA